MIYIVGLVALPIVGIAMELRALWRGAKEDKSAGGYIAAIAGTLGVLVMIVMMILDMNHYI